MQAMGKNHHASPYRALGFRSETSGSWTEHKEMDGRKTPEGLATSHNPSRSWQWMSNTGWVAGARRRCEGPQSGGGSASPCCVAGAHVSTARLSTKLLMKHLERAALTGLASTPPPALPHPSLRAASPNPPARLRCRQNSGFRTRVRAARDSHTLGRRRTEAQALLRSKNPSGPAIRCG